MVFSIKVLLWIYLGAALRLAIQNSISSTSGGRMGVAKVVVMLVTDRSMDSVQEPANEALTAGMLLQACFILKQVNS